MNDKNNRTFWAYCEDETTGYTFECLIYADSYDKAYAMAETNCTIEGFYNPIIDLEEN